MGWRDLLHIEELSDRIDHVEGLWDGQLLQAVAIWSGDIGTSDTQDGTIKVVKSSTCGYKQWSKARQGTSKEYTHLW